MAIGDVGHNTGNGDQPWFFAGMANGSHTYEVWRPNNHEYGQGVKDDSGMLLMYNSPLPIDADATPLASLSCDSLQTT